MAGILFLFDDLGADGVMKHNKLLDRLFTQGRHIFASTLIAQQSWKMASSIQRSQATLVIYGRPRSDLDKKKFIEENGSLAGGDKNLEEMLKIATEEKYGFLTLDLLQQERSKRFLKKIGTYLSP